MYTPTVCTVTADTPTCGTQLSYIYTYQEVQQIGTNASCKYIRTPCAGTFLHGTALTMSKALSLLLLPSTDCRPNAVTTKNTAPVARFLRSASDSTSGTVCIVQSGQRREGLRRSQKLTKHKCSHVNWRTGVGVAIAGLSCLEQSKQRKITM